VYLKKQISRAAAMQELHHGEIMRMQQSFGFSFPKIIRMVIDSIFHFHVSKLYKSFSLDKNSSDLYALQIFDLWNNYLFNCKILAHISQSIYHLISFLNYFSR
jgi:hypothetical protein